MLLCVTLRNNNDSLLPNIMGAMHLSLIVPRVYAFILNFLDNEMMQKT
jgi:hypothetical protein